MSEVDKGYQLEVLKMMTNTYLNETISVTQEGLKSLEANRDQFVWELATRIYSQSGHKVEFCTVRDVVNSRIEAMKYQLAAEKDRIAEQAQRIAEEKARQAAKEARLRDEMTRIVGELGGNESQAKVFVKVRKIVSEQLAVDENEVNLDSHLSSDLGADADSSDLVEIVMALEEEFDIEISDGETEDKLGIFYSSGYSSGGGSFWGMLGSISVSSSSYSSSGRAGANCIVKNFVDLICKKVC